MSILHWLGLVVTLFILFASVRLMVIDALSYLKEGKEE